MKIFYQQKFPELWYNAQVTHTARTLVLTIHFAASSPEQNENLHVNYMYILSSRGFIRTQRTPLVTGLTQEQKGHFDPTYGF